MPAAPRSKKFESETVLASAVVEWLRADGWDVFCEVSCAGSVADMVAVRCGVLWVVECKLAFGLDVMEQGEGWRRYAHQVSVAVPVSKSTNSNSFHVHLCRRLGLGVLKVRPAGDVGPYDPAVEVVERPEFIREPWGGRITKLRSALMPEQRHYAAPGNAAGARFTPFKRTATALLEVVRAEPGVSVKVAVERLRGVHHYRTDPSARAALVEWARAGKVPGVRVVVGKDGVLRFILADLSG